MPGSRHRLIGLLLLSPLLLAGCGKSAPGELAAVSGKVTYEGRPLSSGTIVFVPDGARGTSGEMGCAEIQADGSYRLKSGEAAGIVPGWHRVTIAAVEVVPPRPGEPFPVPRSLVPARYRDPELSGLSCEVKAGRDNAINFNLE